MPADDTITNFAPCRRVHPDPVRHAIACFALDLARTLQTLEPGNRLRILCAIRAQANEEINLLLTDNPALTAPPA